jgi:hypothetical protein
MALWMNNGTINVVNGSNVVSGVGTAFLTSANPARVGQPMIIADVMYEIEKVASDTSILLAANYRGATANGVAYSVVTTTEGSSTDLARRAAQVMGYYQGQLDVIQALIAGTGNVTATLPDGTVITLPAWSELKKIENIKPGTMQGPMAVADIKGALTVDNQRSISYRDQSNTEFHTFAFGNYLRIAFGEAGETKLFDFSPSAVESNAAFYSKSGIISRNSTKSNWLALETPESADPYISSRGMSEQATTVAMRFGSAITILKPALFSETISSSNNVNRAWSSYGVANFRATEYLSSPGTLRAAISYPFKLIGGYALDAYLGTFTSSSSYSGLTHVLGFTDGVTYTPAWGFAADGTLTYYQQASSSTRGTITSTSAMTAPSFTPTSDARLKPESSRKDLKEASLILRQFNPKFYFKKYTIDSEQGEWEFGHIADEVQKIEPRLVKEVGDDKLKCLSTDGITAHLVKGWQEHDEIISQLQLLNLPARLKVIERQLGILDADGMRQP